MKDLFLSGILFLLFSISSGCSKSNNGNNSQPTISNWNVGGASFQGVDTYWGFHELVSKDSIGNTLHIVFFQQPDSNATYYLVSSPPVNNTECYIVFYSLFAQFNSGGVVGDKVYVSITGKKVVASFSNVTFDFNTGNGDSLAKASGTIIQQ